jgi:hypothetical protein
MNKILGVFSIAAALVGTQAWAMAAADPTPQSVDDLRQHGYTVHTITPIYGQLLVTGVPPGFATVFENISGGHYIREAVLQGETVDKWTQMLTVTGDKSWASNPNLTPKKFAEIKAGAFRNACPSSFSAKSIGEGKIGGHDGFMVVLSCGTSPSTAGQTSESALIVIIKGESDYYTIQWAERAAKSSAPIEIKPEKWVERFNRLKPIKLCAIVQGESAPYPSCVGGK